MPEPHRGDASASSHACALFLCGDVMIGRGIDQILRHPSHPALYEPSISSAIEYVALAEHASGPIPRGVDDSYVWGAALEELERRKPSARIINLETSITTSDDAVPKGINYRMHPANVGVLTAAHIDCAVLANNHVLDWGESGLRETLDTLAAARIPVAGAGFARSEAEKPAILDVGLGHRVLVFAMAAVDSGVPADWRATPTHPGVNWIGDHSALTVTHVAETIAPHKRRGDIVLVSIHWGSNWGYDIPSEHRAFARRLIDDASVDVVYGHSSHHVKAMQVYHDRLILYGCGDFLNDYEGIHGRKHFRDDLTLMYFPVVDALTGELVDLEVVPLLIQNFRLQRPATADAHWLHDTVDRECRRFSARLVMRAGALHLEWR
jgi:poly-gamma-glutamate synthesis protein (capsule biosynthesis protein)